MSTNGQIDRRLRELLIRLMGVPGAKLGPDAQLMRDLGIDGDDAADFIRAFAREFGVDMSLFEFDSYFGPEAGFDPLRWLYRKAFNTGPVYSPITIRDLESAALAGKWLRDPAST